MIIYFNWLEVKVFYTCWMEIINYENKKNPHLKSTGQSSLNKNYQDIILVRSFSIASERALT